MSDLLALACTRHLVSLKIPTYLTFFVCYLFNHYQAGPHFGDRGEQADPDGAAPDVERALGISEEGPREAQPLLAKARMVDESDIAFVAKKKAYVKANSNKNKLKVVDGFVLPPVRCQGTGSNVPPGLTASTNGSFGTKLEAHQAACFLACHFPVLNSVLVAAVKAFNSASFLTLRGPKGETLAPLQARAYADYLYKIFAKFLVYDARVCALLLLLFPIAYLNGSSLQAPPLLGCGELPIYGVAKEFGLYLAVITADFFEGLKAAPREDAVQQVLLKHGENIRASEQALLDAKTAEERRAADLNAREQEAKAAAQERVRCFREASEKKHKAKIAALKATEKQRKAEKKAKEEARLAAIRGENRAL